MDSLEHLGNPIGGLVFSNAFTKGDKVEQIHEWTNFMASNQFCFRACKPQASAPGWCQHIYDVLGCQWNMPGNYDSGVFENCKADSGEVSDSYWICVRRCKLIQWSVLDDGRIRWIDVQTRGARDPTSTPRTIIVQLLHGIVDWEPSPCCECL